MLLKGDAYKIRTVPQDRAIHSHALQSVMVADARKRAADTVARDGNLDVTNYQQRLGRTFSGTQLISLLSRLNRNLIFERSNSDASKFGIYIMKDVMNPATWGWYRKKTFITGMEAGLNPEYSVIVPKQIDMGGGKKQRVMEREIRGWRTVLAALYKNKLLTETQITQTFKTDQNSGLSKHWQERMSGGGIIVSGF